MKVWLAQVEDYDDHTVAVVAASLEGAIAYLHEQNTEMTKWKQEPARDGRMCLIAERNVGHAYYDSKCWLIEERDVRA